jgi:hypothetical protein
MVYAIQRLFGELYELGCYCICLVLVAQRVLGKELDFIKTILNLVDKGLVDYRYNDPSYKDNFLVKDTQKVIDELVGKGKVKYHYEGLSYKLNPKDFYIEEWFWKERHFKLPDYDPLGTSQTALNGKIISKRVFTLLT